MDAPLGTWDIGVQGVKTTENGTLRAGWGSVPVRISAAKIFASARDFFTANGTVGEEAMKQSLDINKRAVRAIAREQSQADVFEFGPIKLARQQLESIGWQP